MAPRKKTSGRFAYLVAGGALAVFISAYFVVPFFNRDIYQLNEKKLLAEASGTSTVPEAVSIHVPLPEAVKAIYMTSCAATTPSFRSHFYNLLDTTELNSVIIDIKDFTGTISFEPKDPNLKEIVSTGCKVKDMEEFVAELHSRGVYVIGRVTVFQDPLFTKLRPDLAVKRSSDGGVWKDRKGLSFLDPGSKEAWDHTVAIAKESYALGFDEINFDYIRFPSDGNMRDIAFPWSKGEPKAQVLERFFKYLRAELEGTGVIMSADLFGMTTTAYDDMNIGQVLETALPYFDFVAPMVYPSHYPATFNGWANPNAHPYELIKFVMDSAVQRSVATSTWIKTLDGTYIASSSPRRYTKEAFDPNKIRPWLQDFSLGQPRYTPDMVRAQINATYAAGLSSWMLWDAANKYSPAALLPKEQ